MMGIEHMKVQQEQPSRRMLVPSDDISNYDVLVDKLQIGPFGNRNNANNVDNEPPLIQLYTASKHVGNNRFLVMLKMFLTEFQEAAASRTNDNENNASADRAQVAVVEKVVSTVCNKCVPAGRFLMATTAAVSTVSPSVTAGGGIPPSISWRVMNRDEINHFVWNMLKATSAVCNNHKPSTATTKIAATKTTSLRSPEGAQFHSSTRITTAPEVAASMDSTSLFGGEGKDRQFRRAASVGSDVLSGLLARYARADPRNNTSNIEIGNYDILLIEVPPKSASISSDISDDRFELYNHTQHVGNKRFEILLNMFQNDFEQASSEVNAASSAINEKRSTPTDIVNKILEIVCHQCKPPGRFLIANLNYEYGGDNDDNDLINWSVLENKERMQTIVLTMLKQAVADPSGCTWKHSPNASASFSSPPAPVLSSTPRPGHTIQKRRITALGEEALLRSMMTVNGPLFGPISSSSSSLSPSVKRLAGEEDANDISSKNNNNSNSSKNNTNGGKVSAADHERKRPRPNLGTTTSRDDNHHQTFLAAAEELDVIFNEKCSELIQSHTGNNRLNVLLLIRPQSDSTNINHLMTAVAEWGGRFLAEVRFTTTPSTDVQCVGSGDSLPSSPDGYILLDQNQASTALQKVLALHNAIPAK